MIKHTLTFFLLHSLQPFLEYFERFLFILVYSSMLLLSFRSKVKKKFQRLIPMFLISFNFFFFFFFFYYFAPCQTRTNNYLIFLLLSFQLAKLFSLVLCKYVPFTKSGSFVFRLYLQKK